MIGWLMERLREKVKERPMDHETYLPDEEDSREFSEAAEYDDLDDDEPQSYIEDGEP